MALSQQILNLPFESYDVFTTTPSFNLQAHVNSNLTLQYESQNNSVVNVNSSGNITIIGPGKTTVKIYNNGNSTWKAIEKLILINVSKKQQEIFFFPIDNRYIDDPPFSLNAYASSSSGLPIKYKSLTPNIAYISDDGKVIISGPGRVIFEASQDGNFEWSSTKIIKEFGVSLREYPLDLELISEKSNTLIKLNLYKNQNKEVDLVNNDLSFINSNLINIKNVSGGLYFGDTKYSLKENFILPTGEYIGLINYEYIESGVSDINLNTYYSFSKKDFTGSNFNNYISFSVNRSGFINYGIDLVVHGIFDKGVGYKYASKLALESGIFWTGSFQPNNPELIFSLPLFYSNKLENEIYGKLKFYFKNSGVVPMSLLKLGNFSEANFIIKTGSVPNTLGIGITPYFPKDLGNDFLNFRPASFSSNQSIPLI